MTTLSIDAARHAPSAGRWAGLAGLAHGDPDAWDRAFVLLHGLTFDRRMWEPVLDALPLRHRAIALDLPGHGDSAALPSHRLADVVDAIHDAVLDAGLDAPIVVGHSIGGAIAGLYGATHPAVAVVSVESPLDLRPFAEMARSLKPQLRGDGFDAVWARYRESMRLDLVPPVARHLLGAGDHATQEQVVGYWEDLLGLPMDRLLAWIGDALERIRAAGLPALLMYGRAPGEAELEAAAARLPHAEVVVWPAGHHFPHLADPTRFAALLTGLATALPAPGAAGWPASDRRRPMDE